MRKASAILALIVFFASSVTGGFVVVFCPKPVCEARPAAACHAEEPAECRPCCPAEGSCPMQESCARPEAEPDQTRVVLMPLLAVTACDVQQCSSVCTGSSLSDFREQQMPSKPDPILTSVLTHSSFAFESPPPADIHASRPDGACPYLQTFVLRC